MDEFVVLLRNRYGSNCLWFDEGLLGGDDWWQTILEQIADCELFIYLISNEGLASHYCQDEFKEANRLEKAFLPVIVRPKTQYFREDIPDDLQKALRKTHHVDMSKGFKEQEIITSLFASIDKLLRIPFDQTVLNASQHQQRLDTLFKASYARCLERWQSAGLSRAEAISFFEDERVGALKPEFFPTQEKPVVLLIADIGGGKSLIAERFFQWALKQGENTSDMPIPLFIDSGNFTGNLTEIIQDTIDKQVQPNRNLYLIFDGADELGIAQASELLSEARLLTNRWDNLRVIITSLPLPWLSDQKEATPIPRLTEEEVLQMVNRIIGREMKFLPDWPVPVRDTVTLPRYAIFFGVYHRDHEKVPYSTGQLMTGFVDKTLKHHASQVSEFFDLLVRLAVLSTDRGNSFITAVEVASESEVASLLDSRLVSQRENLIGFSLSIFRYWFAAKSLVAAPSKVHELIADPKILENWRYALIIAVSEESHENLFPILKSLAEHRPGFSAQVVVEGLAGPTRIEQVAPPTKLESGNRLTDTMGSWVNGIERLSRRIAPVDNHYHVFPPNVDVTDDIVTVGWGNKDITKPPGYYRMATYSTPSQSAWAWRITLQYLVDNLEDLVRKASFFANESPLTEEVLWRTAVVFVEHTDYSRKYTLSLDEIEESLIILDSSSSVQFGSVTNGLYDREDPRVILLKQAITRLRDEGKTSIERPGPGPDLRPQGSGRWIWELYSEEQLLRRVRYVYQAALESYPKVINYWFPKFGLDLPMYSSLPIHFRGALLPTKDAQSPQLYYWTEVLRSPLRMIGIEKNEKSEVKIELANSKNDVSRILLSGTRYANQPNSEAAQDFLARVSMRGISSDMLGDNPITTLVHDWLEQDLRFTGWLGGIRFGISGRW